MIIAIAIGVPLVITLGILVANRRKGSGTPSCNSGDTSSGYLPGVTDSTGSPHRDGGGHQHSDHCGHGHDGGGDSGGGDAGGSDGGGGLN